MPTGRGRGRLQGPARPRALTPDLQFSEGAARPPRWPQAALVLRKQLTLGPKGQAGRGEGFQSRCDGPWNPSTSPLESITQGLGFLISKGVPIRCFAWL